MAQSDGLEAGFLRQRAHSLSRALSFRLDEYVEDFPTGEPLELITLFKRIAVETDKTIESTSDANRLSLIAQTLAEVSNHVMSLLDHAHTAQTPRGLAQMLQELQDGIFPKSVIFVTPLAEYNYTIGNHYPALRKALRSKLVPALVWDEISSRYQQGLSVVRFPRIERENILLHAIFGHEFGHPIADAFLKEEQESDAYHEELERTQLLVSQEFDKDLQTESDSLKRVRIHGELCNTVTLLRQRGLEELISDIVAVMLFGASALFAAAEILIPPGLDTPPIPQEFYPPSRMRLRAMCMVLESHGHFDVLRNTPVMAESVDLGAAAVKYVDRLQALAAITTDEAAINDHRLARIAYDWIRKTLDRAKYFAEDRLRTISYSAEQSARDFAESLRRIHLGVPPGEVGTFPNVTAIDWRTALLVGWIYKIHLRDAADLPWAQRASEIAKTEARAHKGIEDSLLRSRYLKAFPTALGAGTR